MGDNEYRILVERLIGYKADGTPVYYIEIAGDSTWSKPTTWKGGAICDSSIATESDTGKVYFFNEESTDWVEQFAFQS